MNKVSELEIMEKWAKKIKDIEDRMLEEEYEKTQNIRLIETGTYFLRRY